MLNQPLKVSEFVALVNQTLEYAYPMVVIDGEVSGYTLNQNKFIFFDIKDEEALVGCFMMAYQLKVPIEDGMKVRVTATVKLTNKGRFSLTVREVTPLGEGELSRAFELLRQKLDKEGLFLPERKRPLPAMPDTIGVISSAEAAGFKDFVKLIKARWGGVTLKLAQVQVQGDKAPEQIVRAIEYFNQLPQPVDTLALIRGGGSLEDLWAFNTEPVVRAIAGSRTPVIVGVGHEQDESLADLVADVRASTPTHAAELVVPSRQTLQQHISQTQNWLRQRALGEVAARVAISHQSITSAMHRAISLTQQKLDSFSQQLKAYDPQSAMRRGYSVLRLSGQLVRSIEQIKPGCTIEAEIIDGIITAKVDHAKPK